MQRSAVLVASLASSSAAFPRTFEIAPGVEMPSMNLGTCCGSDPTLGVGPWLAAGGVGIDTAWDYNDQPQIAAQLKATGAKRSDLFLTTKVPAGLGDPGDCSLDPEASFLKVADDLKQLQVSYVDLVVLHAPCELMLHLEVDPAEANAAMWAGLEKALKMGMTRAIGVSNYNKAQLQALQSHPRTAVKPAINQCHMSLIGKAACPPQWKTCLHNGGHDDETIQYCHENGITYESYEAIQGCAWTDERVKVMASRYGASVAQVCTAWALQRGAVIVAGTGHNVTKIPADTKDNLGVLSLGFEFTDAEMEYLNSLRKLPSDGDAADLAPETLVV